MDIAARLALDKWEPDDSTTHVSRSPLTQTKLDFATAGPGSFAACASFQLPDGGRFSLILNGSLSEDAVVPIVEGDVGLPDGFLIDVNNHIITTVVDRSPPYTPDQIVRATLVYINQRYEKTVSPPSKSSDSKPEPSKEEDNSKNAAAGTAKSTSYSRKRKAALAFKYVAPVFGQTRLATATLMKQLNLLSKMNTRKDGFTAKPIEDNLYKWSVELFFDDTSSKIAADLLAMPSHDHVEMEFNFPAEYPNTPPVVRVVSPHVTGGHVAAHGGICMELLTGSGWAPVNSIDVVCIQIRAMLIHGRARILPDSQHKNRDYTLDGALQDLRKIVLYHTWFTSRTRSKRVLRS